jgi:3-oxoacyl-[acyl-carrier-protein] synthase III
MTQKTFSRIAGTGSYLPKKILSNADLEKMIDTTDEWIFSRTGIRERHIAAKSEHTSDLALEAANNAIASAGIVADDIDLIIVATTTPDKIFPSVATMVQRKLGIAGCPAFDIQAVCSGFVYALATADNFIKAGSTKCALVIGAESFSSIVDYTDRSNCILWGDGAGAVILQASQEQGIISTHLHADGNYEKMLHVPRKHDGTPDTVHMEGNAVFKMAVNTLDQIVDETLTANNMQKSDIDWLVPHQANLRIIDACGKRMGLDPSKVMINIDRYGNTTAATIPMCLSEYWADGRLRRGQRLVLSAFGAGYTWGSVLVRWSVPDANVAAK